MSIAKDPNSEQTFVVRRLAPEQDLPGWLGLIHALEIEQSGQARSTGEQLRQALARPRFQRWVIAAPGEPHSLLAYGMLYPQIKERSALDVYVHPDWRRRGLGSLLLNQLLAEARRIGADWANLEIIDTNAAAIAFLTKHAFQPAADAWLLRAPAEVEFREPDWPAGYQVRSFAEVNSLDLFVEAANRGYGHLWGHHENTAGGIPIEDAQRILALFDAQDIFLLFSPEGKPVGLTRVEPVARTGGQEDVLDGPGVAPELRSRYLQRELALHALGWLRGQGRLAVRLESWGDTVETVRLYEAIGFQVAEHYLAYRKALVPTR